MHLQPDYNTIATYFGEGTNQGSIEWRFRAIRKMAEGLEKELSGEATPSTPKKDTGETAKKSTPKTPLSGTFFILLSVSSLMISGVKSGRVKKTPPTKRSKAKQEASTTEDQSLEEETED
jgi:hypothetical protein